ncbi:MAG: hypothetical protein E7247_01030 [Paenibacillaceae bacterium]|nr:hypothetical protein [Paenibacillaceae bacterium]
MAVEYGTIGTRPRGSWDPDTKYDLLNLVSYDGSSYVAHTDPPKGSLPTDINYWQTSAQGTSKATANSVGTVKPDGTTTEVSADGSLSAKTATQSSLGLVKGSNGIKVDTDGSIDVNTLFTQATELANIIAEEAISSVLGKISKSIAVTMGLNENALLKNMLTNIDANDNTKINTAAFVHTLYERIGMATELTAGENLTAAANALNSNLTTVSNSVNNMSTGQCTAWNGTTFEINYAYKIGKIAVISVQGNNAQLSTNNGFALFTVPWTPSHNLGLNAMVRNPSTGNYIPAPFQLKTAGIAVENENANTGYTWFRVNFVYFTA